MTKDELIKEKEKTIGEIANLREELFDYNDKINEVGKSVSFINLIIIPLLVAIIVTLVISLIFNDPNREIGSFIFTFIVSLLVSTMINKKRVGERKEELKLLRMEIQKLIVIKSKRLSEIEKLLNNWFAKILKLSIVLAVTPLEC